MDRRSTSRSGRHEGDDTRRNGAPPIDPERLRDLLGEYPVRLAVLFGSQATGDADGRSDVDVAIELESHDEATAKLYLRILTDLSIALERDDVDLALVEDLQPRVGLEAFTHGTLLVGSAERMAAHRERFERRVERLEATEPPLDERFDAALDRISDAVGGQP